MKLDISEICDLPLLIVIYLWYIIIKTHGRPSLYGSRMASGSRQRSRRQQVLRAQGAAHPRPQAVTDPLFRDSAFFDPNDLVQVKYEMLRSVDKDGRAVVDAAEAFGLSRPVFYVTRESVQPRGPAGAVAPKTRAEAPAQAYRRSACRPGAGGSAMPSTCQAARS